MERRELLSAAHFYGFAFGGFGGGCFSGGGTLPFSEVPTVVQTGLTNLATTDGFAAPAATQRVRLANKNGIESYTITESKTGEVAQLTVDVTGTAVTPPTVTTTTFGAITNTLVTGEITTIASALGLTAPASTTNVTVSTPAKGPATYTIRLNNSSGWGGRSFSVDDNGDPVGNESLPLSTLPAAIQTGLTSNAPTGATALTSTSMVRVKTLNGVTTYSAHYTGAGISAVVTVDESGALASLPSTSTVQFSTIPGAAQVELQTLATDAGVTGTISATQNVQAYSEGNGTTVYTVRLPASKTGKNGGTYTYMISLSSDQAGNPTVPPTEQRGFFGGFDRFRFGWC